MWNKMRNEMLSIKSIVIEKLFGTLNHQIEFNKEDDMTILLGQNGIGKTAILRLLNMLFNHQISSITEIPFKRAVISFNEGKELHITLSKGDADNVLDYELTNGDFLESISCSLIADRVRETLREIRGYTTANYKNDDDVWIDRITGECLTSEELIWKCQEKHPGQLVNTKDIYPEWLYEIIDGMHVNFIHTQRLQTVAATIIPGKIVNRSSLEYQSTLKLIANEMKVRLARIQQEYGKKASELDESYPYRLVAKMEDLVFTKSELTSLTVSLDAIEEKREKLRDAGLLSKTKWQSRKFSTKTRSAYVLKAISLYIKDTEEKFSIFDDELKRIELFRSLINERFFQKVVVIDPSEGICIESTETGFDIPLEKLSSGEQHLIVLYYDMIFRYERGTLVLVDEPEISLHVSWQKRFVSEMKKIMKINGMKAIIATHSPTLIGRYWGLTRELDKNIEEQGDGAEE